MPSLSLFSLIEQPAGISHPRVAVIFSIVCAAIALALLFPPFGYLINPFYQVGYGRPAITRVEFGHDYFGASEP